MFIIGAAFIMGRAIRTADAPAHNDREAQS